MKKQQVYFWLIILTCLMMLTPLSALANTINIPDDFNTIQAGIDASEQGDTVLVAPGVYVENITFPAWEIALGSMFFLTSDSTMIDSTIIDGNQNGSTVLFTNLGDLNSVLTGFTITNGNGAEYGRNKYGGGVLIHNSNPTVTNNKIIQNTARFGGGVYFEDVSHAIFHDNVIRMNNVTLQESSEGGGIAIHTCDSIMIRNCVIEANAVSITGSGGRGGGFEISESLVYLDNCDISRNVAGEQGGGIYALYTNLYLTNSTVQADSAFEQGCGGIFCHSCDTVSIQDCNISDNYIERGIGGGIHASHAYVIVENTIFDNNQNGGALSFHECEFYLSGIEVTNNTGWEASGILATECTGVIENSEISDNQGLSDRSSHYGIRMMGELEVNNTIIKGHDVWGIQASPIARYNHVICVENGGGIFFGGDYLEIINSTIADNDFGARIVTNRGGPGNAFILNSIFDNETINIHTWRDAEEDVMNIYISHSNIVGGENSILNQGFQAIIDFMEGIMDADP